MGCEEHEQCMCEDCLSWRQLKSMPDEEVNEELRQAGIDPDQTFIDMCVMLGTSESLAQEVREEWMRMAERRLSADT